MNCRFGCTVREELLTLVYYPDGCFCFPDSEQWLCPQHTIKGLQNNQGWTLKGYLHEEMKHHHAGIP